MPSRLKRTLADGAVSSQSFRRCPSEIGVPLLCQAVFTQSEKLFRARKVFECNLLLLTIVSSLTETAARYETRYFSAEQL